jgi:hypothetical protein
MVHWTGILNLVALIAATSMVVALWSWGGWHWYAAILLWPIIYLGIPIVTGLAQGVFIGRDMRRELAKLAETRESD